MTGMGGGVSSGGADGKGSDMSGGDTKGQEMKGADTRGMPGAARPAIPATSPR